MHIYLKRSILAVATFALLIGLVLFYLFWSSGYFATNAIYETENGAIDGYDPVAYFVSRQAKKGSEAFQSEYLGATWFFATQENKNLFDQEPERYLPAYGGYCAFAMSEDYVAYTDPHSWTISGDRLFLNYNQSVQTQWREEKDVRIAAANSNWIQSKPGKNADALR